MLRGLAAMALTPPVRAILHGPLPGDTPWKDVAHLKFLCPVPGYDWHFHMLAMLGVECVPVPLVDGSPDMDMVERLARDPSVKGIICVPMYGNPSGLTFSDEAVRRLARMETAAQDFRIFWDNAYCVHHLYAGRRDHLLNIYEACREAGTEDRPLLFTSTSKITFAGPGVALTTVRKALKNKSFDVQVQAKGAEGVVAGLQDRGVGHCFFLPEGVEYCIIV